MRLATDWRCLNIVKLLGFFLEKLRFFWKENQIISNGQLKFKLKSSPNPQIFWNLRNSRNVIKLLCNFHEKKSSRIRYLHEISTSNVIRHGNKIIELVLKLTNFSSSIARVNLKVKSRRRCRVSRLKVLHNESLL